MCANALDCDTIFANLFIDLFLYRQSNLMQPFPAHNHATLTAEKDAVPGAKISEVPSLLVSCNPMTSQPFAAQVLSRVSMCLIPLTPLTAAVRTLNVPNVSSPSRDLALAALRFLRADFLSASFLCRFFRANTLRLSLSSRWFLPKFLPSFFRHVECGTPTTPRLLHRRHFCLLARALRAFVLSSLRVPRFPRRRCPNFATASTVAAGNDFALLGASQPVDAVGRLALSASTSSRINRCHEGALIHARTL